MNTVIYATKCEGNNYLEDTKYIGHDFEEAKKVGSKFSGKYLIIHVELWVGEVKVKTYSRRPDGEWHVVSDLGTASLEKAQKLIDELREHVFNLSIVSAIQGGLDESKELQELSEESLALNKACESLYTMAIVKEGFKK